MRRRNRRKECVWPAWFGIIDAGFLCEYVSM